MRISSVLSKPLSPKLVISLLLLVVILLGGAGIYFYLYSKRKSSSTETPTIKLSCPVPEEYCSSYVLLGDEGASRGLGYNLPVGTPILAAMDGVVSAGVMHTQTREFPVISIGNAAGYTLHYTFEGISFKGSGEAVSPGVQIGEIRDLYPAEKDFLKFNLNLQLRAPGGPLVTGLERYIK